MQRLNAGTEKHQNDRPANCGRQPAPLTGSQRVALSRRRKRKDIVFVGIEILPTERDALIRIGLLNRVARNDKVAVRDAIMPILRSIWTRKHHRRRPDVDVRFWG